MEGKRKENKMTPSISIHIFENVWFTYEVPRMINSLSMFLSADGLMFYR